MSDPAGTVASSIPDQPAREVTKRRGLRAVRLIQALLWMLIGLGLAGVVWHGWGVREWFWEQSTGGRFRYDIRRNFNFGQDALTTGLLNLYDRQAINEPDPNVKINYGPLRTVVFAIWAADARAGAPNDERVEWRPEFAFSRFLNHFNTSIELLGAVAAALLVLHWAGLKHATPTRGPPLLGWPVRTLMASAVAFCFFWYNPASIVLGHGWPSANVWVAPFFLWAVLFASWEKWFVSGIVLGVGAMLQGQQLLVAAIFPLWPLFAGQPGRSLRWLAGFVLCVGVVVSGWMLTLPNLSNLASADRVPNVPAIVHVSVAVLMMLTLCLMRHRSRGVETKRKRLITGSLAIVTFLSLSWPALLTSTLISRPVFTLTTSALSALAIVGVWFGSFRRNARYTLAATTGGLLLGCMFLHGASDSWWQLGFLYGTERHPTLTVGWAANLASLLQRRYQFGENLHQRVLDGLFPSLLPEGLELRTLLVTLFATTLLLACVATAIQWRRRDPGFLIAVTLPWMLFVSLAPQVHDRYLAFAACTGAVWIAAGAGWTFIGIGLSILAFMQTARCMIAGNMRYIPSTAPPFVFNREWAAWFDRLFPDIAWAVLLACAMLLFSSFVRTSRRDEPRLLS